MPRIVTALLLFIALSLAAAPRAAMAATVSHVTDLSDPVAVAALDLRRGTIKGRHLAGMTVTAIFDDGTTETLVWRNCTRDGCARNAEGATFEAKQGDSIGRHPINVWPLKTDAALTGIVLERGSLTDFAFSTSGTSGAVEFLRYPRANSSEGEIIFTYDRPLLVAGLLSDGRFDRLTINLSGYSGGSLGEFGVFRFGLRGSCCSVVPLGSTGGYLMASAGLGAGAAALLRRRRRRT